MSDLKNDKNEFQIHSRKSSINENLYKSESTNIRSSFDLTNGKSKYSLSRPSFISLKSRFNGKENIRTDVYGERIAEIVIVHTEFPVIYKESNVDEECQCSVCNIF